MDSSKRQPVGIDTSLVECIVVGVPDAGSVATVAAALSELTESATIRILDIVAVTRSRMSGELSLLPLEEFEIFALPGEPGGGLLSKNDIALASAALLPGSAGVLVVVEDRWAESLSSAAHRVGGRVIGGSRIPRSRIEAALAELPRPSPIP